MTPSPDADPPVSPPDVAPPPPEPAVVAARLLRGADRGALATLLQRPDQAGWPYGSLVMLASDHAARPLLLLSDLAEHSRNLAADGRASLLIDAAASRDSPADTPLTEARLSLVGRIERADDDPTAQARYLARHPDAAVYAGFADFHLYRLIIDTAHLVAGFGRIHWLPGSAIHGTPTPPDLANAEADILEHMNADHGEAVALYATALLRRAPGQWRMTGIDADGCDLRDGGRIARLDFDAPIDGPLAARKTLAALARHARMG